MSFLQFHLHRLIGDRNLEEQSNGLYFREVETASMGTLKEQQRHLRRH